MDRDGCPTGFYDSNRNSCPNYQDASTLQGDPYNQMHGLLDQYGNALSRGDTRTAALAVDSIYQLREQQGHEFHDEDLLLIDQDLHASAADIFDVYYRDGVHNQQHQRQTHRLLNWEDIAFDTQEISYSLTSIINSLAFNPIHSVTHSLRGSLYSLERSMLNMSVQSYGWDSYSQYNCLLYTSPSPRDS